MIVVIHTVSVCQENLILVEQCLPIIKIRLIFGNIILYRRKHSFRFDCIVAVASIYNTEFICGLYCYQFSEVKH